MKKIILSVGGVLLIAVISIVIYLAYLGMFSTYDPVEKEMGPYTFVYEDFTGPYKETGPIFQKVYDALKAEGIKTERGMGIYFDDPRKVAEDKLRSKCGSIIEDKDAEKFDKVKDKFKVLAVEKGSAVVVTFPIKSSMSYMLGPMKCYPILNKYVKEKGYKPVGNAYELYDMKKEVTYYVFPIIR